MDNLRRVLIIAFLVWFIIASSLGIVFASADQENAKETSNSANKYWEKVKSTINQLQIKFFPPDIDFRSIFAPSDKGFNDEGQNSVAATVKQAAEKSFQSGQKAVEESAKSVADVVGEATHVTAEKLKDKISADPNDDDDDDSYKSEL